jgi:mannose-6-phosphate isomerase
MANSDNVIRAGLTPKLRDVPNLVRGLTYTASPPSKHVIVPTPFRNASSAASKLYDPPIPEFSVVQVTLPPGKREIHKKLGGPSVGIVIAGGGVVRWEDETLGIGVGDVFVVGADTQVEFEARGQDELVIYRAFVESTLSV